MDSLLSIVQMPKGIAVGTLAIGTAGAFNAGLLACQILAITDPAPLSVLKIFAKTKLNKYWITQILVKLCRHNIIGDNDMSQGRPSI